MKLLIISTSVFPLPPKAYSGTEMLVFWQAGEMAKRGHSVAVVAPVGSALPEGVELIPVAVGETEESCLGKYKNRLHEFDIIWDNSFGSWAYMESVGLEPNLPIIKTFHTDPSIWSSPPPVHHPCLVGISTDHARRLALHLGVAVERVYNGLDTSFYTPGSGPAKRNGRWLWLFRYTPEKGPLEAAQLAKRLRIPLDMYGDTSIVGDQRFVDRCRYEADGLLVRWHGPVSREKTVELYRSHKGLVYLPNWNEPFGMTPCEAQLCGLPVVTLARGSMPEVVSKDGGFVCDTVAEVEEVIRSCRVETLDAEAIRAGALRFSKEAMTDGYEALFKRMLAGNRW